MRHHQPRNYKRAKVLFMERAVPLSPSQPSWPVSTQKRGAAAGCSRGKQSAAWHLFTAENLHSLIWPIEVLRKEWREAVEIIVFCLYICLFYWVFFDVLFVGLLLFYYFTLFPFYLFIYLFIYASFQTQPVMTNKSIRNRRLIPRIFKYQCAVACKDGLVESFLWGCPCRLC